MGEAKQVSASRTNVLTARAGSDRIVSEPQQKLRCDKHHMPYAVVDYERRVLIITVRHDGEWCESRIPLLDLGLVVTDASSGSGKTSKKGIAKVEENKPPVSEGQAQGTAPTPQMPE